jgi:hypothetical protein
MEQVGIHPVGELSDAEKLLKLLSDPKAAQAKLKELVEATEGLAKATAESSERLQKAQEAHERADKLARHVESRHKGLDQREGECRRLKVANELREASLRESEAQLHARMAAVESALAERESLVAKREAEALRREQAVEAREGAVSALKAELDERAERMRKAAS